MMGKASSMGDKLKSSLKSSLSFNKKSSPEKQDASASPPPTEPSVQPGPAAPAPASPPAPAAASAPPPGSRVRVQGLGKAPQYNGCEAVVLHGDAGEDRVSVQLEGAEGKQLSVRLANLEVLRRHPHKERVLC